VQEELQSKILNFVTLITLEYNLSIRGQASKDTMSCFDFTFFDDGEFNKSQAKAKFSKGDSYCSSGQDKEHEVGALDYSILNLQRMLKQRPAARVWRLHNKCRQGQHPPMKRRRGRKNGLWTNA
jgi:hypothetical protein